MEQMLKQAIVTMQRHYDEPLRLDDLARVATMSKFHFLRDAYRYLLQVLRMVMYFNPIKVLMPVALWMIGIGVIKGIVDLIRYHLRLTTNATLLILSGLIIGAIALLADLIVRSRDDY